MKTSHSFVLTVFLSLSVVFAVCLSCSKNEIGNDPKTQEDVTPTEDALDVTTDVETFCYGTPDAGASYSKSLFDRLKGKVGAYNEKTTKVIVVFANAISSLSEQDCANIYNCYRKGGCVVIVNPGENVFENEFRSKLREAAYKEMVLKYNTEGIDREAFMNRLKEVLFRIDKVRSEHEGEFYECIGFHRGNKYACQQMIPAPEEKFTAWQYGQFADAFARWINGMQESTKGSTDLATWTEGEIFTFTWSAKRYKIKNDSSAPYVATYSNAVDQIIKAYVAYSPKENADYYQVDQYITFHNLVTQACCNNTNTASYGSGYWNGTQVLYISPEKSFQNKLWMTMTGGGSPTILDSHPQSANSSHSESVSTSEGTTHTETNGFNVGFTLGGSKKGGFAGNFNAAFSHSVANGETFSTTTGSSYNISDLSVTKNTVDGKIIWDYDFAKPYQYKSANKWNWWAPKLSYNDCKQQNSLFYMIKNPSGNAVVNYYNLWSYWFAWYNKGEGKNGFHLDMWYDNTKEGSVTLGNPYRYTEKWSLSCVGFGDLTGKPIQMTAFDNMVTKDIIGADNAINDIGGIDKYDNDDANALLQLFMDEFSTFEEKYRAYGYTGTFTYLLKAVDTGREIRKSYTISKE